MADPSFRDFIRRVRAGDQEAAAELVRRYEPVVRLEVRMRLKDRRLRRLFDSMDICQSVLASFFKAVPDGYDLEEPQNLVRLLVGITRNKVAFAVRKQHARRRDNRRTEPAPDWEPAARGPTPSEVVAQRELAQEFQKRLTDEEQRLAALRADGRDWEEVAQEVGGTPQARRKQLTRAIRRVAERLHLL